MEGDMTDVNIDRAQDYADLVAHHGADLAAAVAVLADADGPLLVHGPGDDHQTGLVLALALLAAGLPADQALAGALPAEPNPAALFDALTAIGVLGGPEPYLLRHGLTVSHFLALRERFAGDDAGFAPGDVS
jgi:hypothetical protein